MDRGSQKATRAAQPIEAGLRKRLEAMLKVGLVCVLVGAVLQFVFDGSLARNVSLFELPTALMNLDPAALVSLGIGFFILGPAIGVGYLSLAFFREREPQAAVLAMGVLVIMGASIIIKFILTGMTP